MKGYLINKYYDFLMFLEDVLSGMTGIINNHRRRLDEKYWDKYIDDYQWKKDNKETK